MGGDEVTITMWTHDVQYVEFFTEVANEWAASEHPEIDFTFEFEIVPSLHDVVLANIAGGQPLPDLVGISEFHFPRYLVDDLIEDHFVDLTDRIGTDYDRVVQGRWSIYEWNGKTYAVESALSAVAYYYQPAIFEDEGLVPPETWDEFLESGAALGVEGVASGVLTDAGNVFEFYLHQRGGRVFNEAGDFVLGDPGNRQAAMDVLSLWREGLDSGAFTVVLQSEFWGPSQINAFDQGSIAGTIMPDWYADAILKPQAEHMAGHWALAPMPVWSDGSGLATTVYGGTGFAITKASPNIDLAWDLLRYSYLTVEGQVKRYQMTGYYPTLFEALSDERVLVIEDPYFSDQRLAEVYGAVADQVPIWYQSPYRLAFLSSAAENLPLFFDDDLNSEEFLDRVIQAVETEIEFYG